MNNDNNPSNDYNELLDISNSTNFASKKYKLTLRRPSNFVGCLVGFDIYIDDVKVGKIKNGKTIELEVAGGAHTISIHKSPGQNIFVDKDTTADVVVFGANNFGITNVNGSGSNPSDNNDKYLSKTIKNSNMVLIFSIILPIASAIMIFTIQRYLQPWVHGIVAGYGIVNLFGLKNLKGTNEYKSILTKNIIAIVLSVVAAIAITYLSIW